MPPGLWHERASGGLPNWFAQGFESFSGKVVIGSSQDASLHVLDDTSQTESGNPYLFLAQSAPLHAFPKGLIMDQLDVDIIPGVGITGSNAEAANPELMLDWSDDGGSTWIGGRTASLGRVGERIRGRKLLSARRDAKGRADVPALLVFSGHARHSQRRRARKADTRMTGQANLFSRFGFQVGPDGKIDNYTRAFFSKFRGRVGPAIPDLGDEFFLGADRGQRSTRSSRSSSRKAGSKKASTRTKRRMPMRSRP